MSYKYEQDIICEVCQSLLGYAAYSRTEYKCISCNAKAKDEDEDP